MASVKTKSQPCVLLERTAELMQSRSRLLTIGKIAEETGISKAWLQSFQRQESMSPTVRNVCCLYEYLSGTQLIVN